MRKIRGINKGLFFGRQSLIKMSIFPKLTYGVTIIPMKISAGFFHLVWFGFKNYNLIPIFIWERKGPRRVKRFCKRGTNQVDLHFLISKLIIKVW